MIEISKELLSAVLGVEVTNVRDTMYDNELRFETTDEELRRKFSPYVPKINIYELGFKCKEWALSKDYHINTSEDRFNNYLYLYKIIKDDFGYVIDKSSGVQFDSNDYINDLIKACEWILKKNK